MMMTKIKLKSGALKLENGENNSECDGHALSRGITAFKDLLRAIMRTRGAIQA